MTSEDRNNLLDRLQGLRIRSVLAATRERRAAADLATARARAETEYTERVLADGGVLGKNEAERGRALTLSLEQDKPYQRAWLEHSDAIGEHGLAAAELQTMLDSISLRRLEARERLIELALAHNADAETSPDDALADLVLAGVGATA